MSLLLSTLFSTTALAAPVQSEKNTTEKEYITSEINEDGIAYEIFETKTEKGKSSLMRAPMTVNVKREVVYTFSTISQAANYFTNKLYPKSIPWEEDLGGATLFSGTLKAKGDHWFSGTEVHIFYEGNLVGQS
jgi:hypothetical protein